MPHRPYLVADLFAGAGGTSTGALQALRHLGRRPRLTAINHWRTAVDTHELNHPESRHLCHDLGGLNPRSLYPDPRLDLLWASPECTGHSLALGDNPTTEQSRCSGWCVARWAESLRPSIILVENVPRFTRWGPLGRDGRPLKARQGETFQAWMSAISSLGYTADHRVLCAADYGVPTTRERLFVQFVRGNRPPVWPRPTHLSPAAREGHPDDPRPAWVPAADIINWTHPAESIFTRKRPLNPNTLRRIHIGLHRYGLHPCIVPQQSGGRPVHPLTDPLTTVTTTSRGIGLARPYLVTLRNNANAAPLDLPVKTVTAGGGHHALCTPYIVPYYGTATAAPVDLPLQTVTTRERFGLAWPVLKDRGGKLYEVDILYRMLQPDELAAAQGFPAGYEFTGNKSDVVCQIGNAVPPGLARALVHAAVSRSPDVTLN